MRLRAIVKGSDMKIAILAGSDIRSYAGNRYIIELANALNDDYVAIFTNNKPEEAVMSLDEVKKLTKRDIVYFNSVRFPITRDNIITSMSLWGLRKFDVIYSADPSIFTNIQLLLISKLFKKRFILANHDPAIFRTKPAKQTTARTLLMRLYNPIKFEVFRWIPNMHMINKTDAEFLKNMKYNGNIYQIDNFSYYEMPKNQIKNNNKEFVVLFIGGLRIEQKGIDLLKDIVEKVLKGNKKIKFNLPMNKNDGERIVLSLKEKYQKNVKLLEFRSNDNLENEYKKASLFIMTSRWEGMPAVLIEAQSHGLPAIAFDIKGINDIISNNTTDTLIRPFDTETFAGAIDKDYYIWKEHRNEYLKRKKIVYDRTNEKYSKEVIIPKLKRMLYGK